MTISLRINTQKSSSKEINVAVASNFVEPMQEIATLFEAKTNYKVILSFGATGKHYAQINHGAPFDIFFAADVERPKRLEKQGLTIAKSRFTYALGKLVLWSATLTDIDSEGKILAQNNFRHLAIANPRLAPYGKAAQEVLEQKKLWHQLSNKLVYGENINQTFQFVKSGNAELGFVASSQINNPHHTIEGSCWEIPPNLYNPIEQQAVLLTQNHIAQEFIIFVQSEPALNIIHRYGYDTQ